MKAIILAAGKGERLASAEPSVPKPMIRIAGKPVLQHTIDWLASLGIRDIVVTSSIKAVSLIEFVQDKEIAFTLEDGPSGTAGGVKRAVQRAWSWRATEPVDVPFAVWYGDNFSTCNLNRMLDYHRESRADATIAVIWRSDVRNSGAVEWTGNNRITEFIEKPTRRAAAGWVSAGIYILEPSVLEFLPDKGDFGRDVFPEMLVKGKQLYAYGLSYDEVFRWYDTPEDLAKLREDYP